MRIMRMITRKELLWILLALSVGGTLLFALIVLQKGFPSGRERWLNLWPAAASLTAVFSGWILRRLYRREPSSCAGFWHLSLSDLATGSLVFGATLGFMRAALKDVAFAPAILVSFIMSIAILAGLLAGSRMHFPSERQRYKFGICLGLGMFGLLVVGSLVTALIAFCIYTSSNIFDGISRIYEIAASDSSYSSACLGLFIFIPALLIALRMRHTSVQVAPVLPVRELNSQATAPPPAPQPPATSERHVSTF